MELDRESQLENTLLEALYPEIRVATVDVPRQQLDLYSRRGSSRRWRGCPAMALRIA